MRIHSIVEGTRVNGPGYRLGIWVQGCRRNCPGCFNREACSVTGGREYPVQEILKFLHEQPYDGISVSGGEPFEQEQELALLLKGAKESGVNTLVFTGYTYEEIAGSSAVQYCDFLIDGPYIREIESTCLYTGSGNQRFLRLNKGMITEDLTDGAGNGAESEIIISPDGVITVTGFGTL